MRARIAHRTKNRIRIETPYKFNHKQTNVLKYKLEKIDGVESAKIHSISGSIVVNAKEYSIKYVCKFILDTDVYELDNFIIEDPSFEEQDEKDLFHILRDAFELRFVMKNFLPAPLGTIATCIRAIKFLRRGISAFKEQKLNVEFLDATAIGVSLLSKDFASAASIMFLLDLGEKLEDWTLKKSKLDLKRSLSINVDKVFVKEDDDFVLRPLEKVKKGDIVQVTMGNTIPVDGEIVSGLAMVNQASFTGESEPVKKEIGDSVFAGTVLEDGNICIKTINKYDDSRISTIIEMISESEKNKSLAQKKAESRADALVKFSFLGSLITYALTRNFIKAKSFLMVDYSCALKLTIPIATMRAMRQSSEQSVLVKGGKFLESLAHADTIIFDKTGTLTAAQPIVEKVIPFENNLEEDCLRIAACLEEHFPHSIAKAVVEEAKRRGLNHKEMHSDPEYIVAHGIASTINGKKALIGSEHFIFEDEKVNFPEDKKKIIEALDGDYSLLYLAYDKELIAVICITDPIRPDAKQTIDDLRELGFKNIVMLTGDHENSARFVAKELGLDEYKSQVLPEDKAEFVKKFKEDGHTVVMIGDGINDSIALSMADIGISMYKGTDIAREISDIAIGSDDLSSLIDTIKIAKKLDTRIKKDYREIISINSLLIILGVLGIINNTTSSFVHNTSTVLSAFNNMKDTI